MPVDKNSRKVNPQGGFGETGLISTYIETFFAARVEDEMSENDRRTDGRFSSYVVCKVGFTQFLKLVSFRLY